MTVKRQTTSVTQEEFMERVTMYSLTGKLSDVPCNAKTMEVVVKKVEGYLEYISDPKSVYIFDHNRDVIYRFYTPDDPSTVNETFSLGAMVSVQSTIIKIMVNEL